MESVLAFYNLAPISEKLYNEYGGIETYGKEADKMAYNGPYTVTQWVHEDSLVMERIRITGMQATLVLIRSTAV